MATDIPFWRCETGAQQRMLHLVQGISDEQFGDKACDVKTFFIGVATEEDEAAARRLGLDVGFQSSDRAPDGIRKRIKWHMDGTIHLVRQAFRGRTDVERVDQPMKLEDFRWPWAIEAFSDCVEEFQPDAIIFQYVTMSYLLEGLSRKQRGNILCVVDTHDVLSTREEQFGQFGFSHWINISPHAESDELIKFDAALAIIDQERPVFESMAPTIDVLTVSHSLEPITSRQPAIERPESDSLLTVGYFGSSNHSNGHALIKFIRQVWRPLGNQNAEIRLVIAGSICDWLMFHEESRFASDESMSLWIDLSTDPKVRLMGKIDDPMEFYREIDVAINPVEFGTGLKIKTCESFAYGVPSVVTSSGANAVPPEASDAIFPCKSVREMIPALFAMSIDRQQVNLMRTAAREIAETVFTNDVAYGELVSWFRAS
jgi:glycosyltransferase involved in cell wall biosynthesis